MYSVETYSERVYDDIEGRYVPFEYKHKRYVDLTAVETLREDLKESLLSVKEDTRRYS